MGISCSKRKIRQRNPILWLEREMNVNIRNVSQHSLISLDAMFQFSWIFKKTPVPESLFKKSCRSAACNFVKKETFRQVLSCVFYEIFKNTYCYKIRRVPPSGLTNGISVALEYIIRQEANETENAKATFVTYFNKIKIRWT